jgi:GMP synthase-like glutamine amidotransferase
MRIHVLQHVRFEGPAEIETWAKSRAHTLSTTRLYANAPIPGIDSFDVLVVMGGPMGAADEMTFRWLRDGKHVIEKAIGAGKTVLGVCLGAQLIASVLGAKVCRNPQKEIGWFPVSLAPGAKESKTFGRLPDSFEAFHWHGDTFDLPAGCTHLASSAGCTNQAFESADGRVLGLQFHLEVTQDGINRLIENCSADLTPGPYVQTAGELQNASHHLPDMHEHLYTILDALVPGS